MARTYFRPVENLPFYSNEHGVGVGMANDSLDVMLIQCFLKAILESGRQLYGIQWSRPGGPRLRVSGLWDEASRNYLEHWEGLQVRWKMKERGTTTGGTTMPGTVVPYSKNGKKVVWMNAQVLALYGKVSYIICVWGDVVMPVNLQKQLITYEPERPNLEFIL